MFGMGKDKTRYALTDKAKEILNNEQETIEEKETTKETPIYVADWQWIDGYKCTNLKMQGHGSFQFELNKQFDIDNDKPLSLCNNGFHFCKEIKDLFFYNSYVDSRFFKVKALVDVNSDDYKQYGVIQEIKQKYSYIECYETIKTINLKCVAKSIILTDEIDIKDTYQGFLDHQKDCSEFFKQNCRLSSANSLYINNIDEYLELYKYKTSSKLYTHKIQEFLVSKGFSETFSILFSLDDIGNYKHMIDFITGIVDEDISKDMTVYLIMKEFDKIHNSVTMEQVYHGIPTGRRF